MSRVFETLAPLAARGMVLGLDTMRAALAASGDPQQRIPCVHVAGTNGKGSVSAFLDAALRAAGHHVGLYTSPHLHRFVERIQIDGAALDDATAARLAEDITAAIDRGALPPITFFESATLLAWRAFAEADVRFAVMEVGLGGRLDATTVCAPRVTVITRIGLDHTDRLGATLSEIAREKAGILKRDVPCVLGPDLTHARNPEARTVIEAVARSVGAPLVDTGPFTVDGDRVFEPRLNKYRVDGQTIGTPSVRVGPTDDVYLALTKAPSGEGSAIGLRVIVQPLILWLWVGGIVMVVGTLLALFPGRRRRNPLDPVSAPVVSTLPRRDHEADPGPRPDPDSDPEPEPVPT